jgi:hypothetical protein
LHNYRLLSLDDGSALQQLAERSVSHILFLPVNPEIYRNMNVYHIANMSTSKKNSCGNFNWTKVVGVGWTSFGED